MRNCILSSLAFLSGIGDVAAAWSGMSSGNRAVVVNPSFVLAIRGGANEYETKFENSKCSAIEKALLKVLEILSLI